MTPLEERTSKLAAHITEILSPGEARAELIGKILLLRNLSDVAANAALDHMDCCARVTAYHDEDHQIIPAPNCFRCPR